MKKKVRRVGSVPCKTIFQTPNRPKLNLSTVAAVFQQFNERNAKAALLCDAFSEELFEARLSSIKHLKLRLEQLGIAHRIDWKNATRPDRYAVPPILASYDKSTGFKSIPPAKNGSRGYIPRLEENKALSSSSGNSEKRPNTRNRRKQLRKVASFTSKVREVRERHIAVRRDRFGN